MRIARLLRFLPILARSDRHEYLQNVSELLSLEKHYIECDVLPGKFFRLSTLSLVVLSLFHELIYRSLLFPCSCVRFEIIVHVDGI